MENEWNLTNIPPKDHEDVADFAFQLFEIARLEKERLGKPSDFLNNYALYRGQSSRQMTAKKGSPRQAKNLTPVNLYFANVERTVSTVTARNPTGEVVDLDGVGDDAENVLSMQLKKWWKDTDQLLKTRATARTMEVYGITEEKPYWDKLKDQPDIMITDPFTFFPAPGNWENIAEEAPYICYAYLGFVSKIEAEFKVTGIAKDEAYDLLGSVREDFKPPAYGGQNQTIGNYADPMTVVRPGEGGVAKAIERCLIIEIWLRDDRTKTSTVEKPMLDEKQQPVLDDKGAQKIETISTTEKVCPDGIRKITITKAKNPTSKDKSGYMVLDDSANPNINPALPIEVASTTFPWGKLPAYHANSYKDLVSIWGFAASEQVGDLIVKINLIVSKLIAYVINVMAPPLIVQQHCGITRDMIESSISKAGRLILMPTTPNARIEFLEIPNLPSTFFQVLDLIVKFFDRIYQIEDADRGKSPSGIIAASAIVALQERNAIVMQTKTSAIDNIAEYRARWAIGLWQNFGTQEDSVNLGGQPTPFRGIQFAGRRFNYVVEAGSTTPRTSLQVQELAMKLYEVKAIGQRGLLESLNWPHWKEEIERTAESQLDQAFQILIQAGMPKDAAIKLKQFLMEPQGGPGDTKKTPATNGKGAAPAAPAAPGV
jgi:hypothetical protein